MRIPSWEGNWERRIRDRVGERHFASVTAFAESRPTATLVELADELGAEDVAAVQVEALLRDEARETSSIHRFARSMLVREVHHFFPDGWMRGDRVEWNRAGVWAKWVSRLGQEQKSAAERVWDSLESHVPLGWLPSGPDDPIIMQAFTEGGFPEDADPGGRGKAGGPA